MCHEMQLGQQWYNFKRCRPARRRICGATCRCPSRCSSWWQSPSGRSASLSGRFQSPHSSEEGKAILDEVSPLECFYKANCTSDVRRGGQKNSKSSFQSDFPAAAWCSSSNLTSSHLTDHFTLPDLHCHTVPLWRRVWLGGKPSWSAAQDHLEFHSNRHRKQQSDSRLNLNTEGARSGGVVFTERHSGTRWIQPDEEIRSVSGLGGNCYLLGWRADLRSMASQLHINRLHMFTILTG